MGKTGDTRNTPGTNAAFDLLGRIAVDPEMDERYPNETVLIPADSPDVSTLISRAVTKHRPLVIVYPDGREIVAVPGGGAFAFLKRLLIRERRPKQEHPAITLPADYQVEIRDRPALPA
jgi:hypothetical protein